MIEYVEEIIRIILGDYFFITYSWSAALLDILIFISAILLILLFYKFWKFLIFDLWRCFL